MPGITTHKFHGAYYRLASIAMTLLLVVVIFGPVVVGWHFGWPGLVIGVLLAGVVPGYCSIYPHCRIFGSAIRTVPTALRNVVLTIDDGPCDDTGEILDILAAHRSRAVFFLIGDRAAQRPHDVQRIAAAGHLIGNHTHTHPVYWYWSFPPWKQRRELQQCQQVLASISGFVPVLFRAPAGMRNPYCNLVAAEHSLKVIGWRARGFDGVNTPVEKIVASIRSQLRPGAIILLHQGLPHSPEVLRRVLAMLDEGSWTTILPDAWSTHANTPENPQPVVEGRASP